MFSMVNLPDPDTALEGLGEWPPFVRVYAEASSGFRVGAAEGGGGGGGANDACAVAGARGGEGAESGGGD